jgi:hypothetical protein
MSALADSERHRSVEARAARVHMSCRTILFWKLARQGYTLQIVNQA